MLSQTRKTRPELFNEYRKFRKYGIKLKKELHKTNLVNHQQTLTNAHLSRNNLLQNLCWLNLWHLSFTWKIILWGTTQAIVHPRWIHPSWVFLDSLTLFMINLKHLWHTILLSLHQLRSNIHIFYQPRKFQSI